MAGVLLGPVAGIVEPTSEIQLFLSNWRLRALFPHRPRRNRPPRLYGDHPRAVFCGREPVGGHLGPHLPHRHIRLHQLRFYAGVSNSAKRYVSRGILSLSSLGIVAKVLADKGMLKELIGLRIFTAVIIAEVISLLVVGVTIGELDHDHSVTGVLMLLGQIVGFVVLTWGLIGETASPRHSAPTALVGCARAVVWAVDGWAFPRGGGRRGNRLATAPLVPCSSGPPCRGCPTGCAKTSCLVCGVPRRVYSFRCSLLRPVCT